MRRCALADLGAPKLHRGAHGSFARRGFTLLEMCLVLVIIALLLGATMPAVQSAFVEQGLRTDARQLSLMVRTAMLQSSEQHRAFVIELTPATMVLRPVEKNAPASDSTSTDAGSDEDASDTGDGNVEVLYRLDPANKLLAPDPEKAKAWLPIRSISWLFQSGELCAAPRVRFSRGSAWLEMSFNALTGSVEDETTYFP